MRTVVFAYHDMGIAALEALGRAGWEIACVFSHDDDPHETCWFGSVRDWAAGHGIPVLCPERIGGPEWAGRIAALRPEVVLSAYYRRMLPEEILTIPPRGAYNLHGSLLPAYRGRCPVNWVLIEGETRTGVTLHHMVKKADAGDIVGQRAVAIEERDTAVTLYRKLCEAAGRLLDELLPLMAAGTAPRLPQDLEKGSYFGGRRSEDGRIDWRWPARRIYNLIRAVTDPYPGAFGTLPDGGRLMVWWAEAEEAPAAEETGLPGSVRVEGGGVFVRAGAGRLRLCDVESGGRRMTGAEIARYFAQKEGLRLS